MALGCAARRGTPQRMTGWSMSHANDVRGDTEDAQHGDGGDEPGRIPVHAGGATGGGGDNRAAAPKMTPRSLQ